MVCGCTNNEPLQFVRTEIRDISQDQNFLTEDTYGNECGLTTVHIEVSCGKFCTK